ncbi:MAG: hypothetical protein ABF443_14275 [Acetobacter malorum]|uniref:hypothetical protein n=1 Tax=Acetobacter malorum TaxID=178901 RepID=UPI0039E8DDE6
MKKATTTHNPNRVIAHSLSGPVYAPEFWSDAQVRDFKGPCVTFSAPNQSVHPCEGSARGLLSTGAHRQSAMARQRSLGLAECRWPNVLSFAPQGARYCVRHLAAKLLPTKTLGKNFSYRISMVVVAIAMVVGLRARVNLLSQHTQGAERVA